MFCFCRTDIQGLCVVCVCMLYVCDVHVDVNVCVYVHVHVDVNVCVYVHVRVHVCVRVCVQVSAGTYRGKGRWIPLELQLTDWMLGAKFRSSA